MAHARPDRFRLTASFIGLVVYLWVIHSYKAPIASYAIGLGLFGLLIQPFRLRLPLPLVFFGLFVLWAECGQAGDPAEVKFDRVAVPELSVADLFDDAFTGLARDGAGIVEVVVWLLNALESIAASGDAVMRENALRHARLALVRAEHALKIPDDLTAVRDAARFAVPSGS